MAARCLQHWTDLAHHTTRWPCPKLTGWPPSPPRKSTNSSGAGPEDAAQPQEAESKRTKIVPAMVDKVDGQHVHPARQTHRRPPNADSWVAPKRWRIVSRDDASVTRSCDISVERAVSALAWPFGKSPRVMRRYVECHVDAQDRLLSGWSGVRLFFEDRSGNADTLHAQMSPPPPWIDAVLRAERMAVKLREVEAGNAPAARGYGGRE